MTPIVCAIVDPLPKPEIVTENFSAPSEGSSKYGFSIEDEKYFVFRKLIKNSCAIIIYLNNL
jgi:hypothetical protein